MSHGAVVVGGICLTLASVIAKYAVCCASKIKSRIRIQQILTKALIFHGRITEYVDFRDREEA